MVCGRGRDRGRRAGSGNASCPCGSGRDLSYARDTAYRSRAAGRQLRLEEFANLDLARLYHELKYPIVVDGRNLYDSEIMGSHGFTYYSVGRPAVMAEAQEKGAPVVARKLSQA